MFDSFTKILKLPKGFFHQIRQLLRDCIICILLFVGFRKVVQNLINSFKVSRLKQISGVLQNHGGTKPRTGLRTWIQGSKFEEIEPVSIFSLLLLFIIHSSSYLPLSIIVLVIIISGMLPCVQQRWRWVHTCWWDQVRIISGFTESIEDKKCKAFIIWLSLFRRKKLFLL